MTTNKPPSERELLEAVFNNTDKAFECVRKAWINKSFTREKADEMSNHLRRASAAMESLHCRVRGVEPEKYGK